MDRLNTEKVCTSTPDIEKQPQDPEKPSDVVVRVKVDLMPDKSPLPATTEVKATAGGGENTSTRNSKNRNPWHQWLDGFKNQYMNREDQWSIHWGLLPESALPRAITRTI